MAKGLFRAETWPRPASIRLILSARALFHGPNVVWPKGAQEAGGEGPAKSRVGAMETSRRVLQGRDELSERRPYPKRKLCATRSSYCRRANDLSLGVKDTVGRGGR